MLLVLLKHGEFEAKEVKWQTQVQLGQKQAPGEALVAHCVSQQSVETQHTDPTHKSTKNEKFLLVFFVTIC